MRVQSINQSTIYQIKSRQDRSVGFSKGYENCRPKPKSSFVQHYNSMPSFKAKPKSIQERTLMQEITGLIADTCNSIKESYNKSNTKKILIAPIQKKWSDFAYKAPKLSQAVKGAIYVAAGVSAVDIIKDNFFEN